MSITPDDCIAAIELIRWQLAPRHTKCRICGRSLRLYAAQKTNHIEVTGCCSQEDHSEIKWIIGLDQVR